MSGDCLGVPEQGNAVRGRIKSGAEMDSERREGTAYEYLCHLEEAKNWIEDCIKEKLPASTELEEHLRNGVYFAKLGHFCAPKVVALRKIFDIDQGRWMSHGLHFKHTDNINFFLTAVRKIGLPEIFLPETTDIYDKKNMPRAIFCIHALSLYMFKLGSAPQIQDLCGRVHFSEHDISSMEAELSRTGIEMPQFRNLGCLMADQGGGNSNKIGRAMQEIIHNIRSGDSIKLLESMKSQPAGLQNVVPSNIRQYQFVLDSAVEEKSTGMLSQAEIQGHITRVNLLVCLEKVANAVRSDDARQLNIELRDTGLNVKHMVKDENIELYLTHLVDHVESLSNGEVLMRDTILTAIESANLLGDEREQLELAMSSLNVALRSGTPAETFKCLQHPALRLPGLQDAAQSLYHSELQYIQQETAADLSYEGVCLPVQFLNLVASVGIAALAGDFESAWKNLACPDLAIQDLDHAASTRYGAELVKLARSKDSVLTHGELQLAVDRVNNVLDKDIVRLTAVEAVNAALARGGRGLNEALKLTGLGFENTKMSKGDEIRFIEELQNRLSNKSIHGEEGVGLWYEDIVSGVETVIESIKEVECFVGVLRGLNSAVENGDKLGVLNYLSNNRENLGLSMRPDADLASEYIRELQSRMKNKRGSHTWVEVYLSSSSRVWIEVEGGRHSWMEPHTRGEANVLSVADIQAAVDGVSGVNSPKFLKSLVYFQSRSRGALVRRKLYSMLDWYYRRESDIVKIQALWRGRRVRKIVSQVLSSKLEDRQKRKQEIDLKEFKKYEKKIILIQRSWRAKLARNQWMEMVNFGTANLETVVKHMYLLDVRDQDFREELDLQSARGELSKLIRHNDQLEKELDEMDVKIGLLVQNRISVQDCVLEKHRGNGISLTLKRERVKSSNNSSDMGTHRGLKALKKESHDKLLAYQHLFYLLQTDPSYLAKLMFAMPQSKTNKFLESVILTLYNFGGNVREEFLLLQLFKTALVEEVYTKVEKINDVVVGNPLVVKLVISYNRSGRGGYGLKELLGPLIKQVLEDTKLKINTNPVEVYKLWINQLECETGVACGLPYDVTQETALGYEEVQKRLAKSIKDLKRMVTLFMATILNGIDKFPYGILYIAKILYEVMQERFPESLEKDILKVVGNLVYYRYVNPTIVAPERFDMVEKKVDQNLSNDQRRNLGSIAKILQFAASKKGFGEESEHLMVLNPFIIECHEKFKNFFLQCCSVPEPEVYFNIDQFTEAVLIAKPSIYISLSELCDTHQLLIDHTDSVAPLPNDPLHQILESLGPPSLCSLLGAADNYSDRDSSMTSLGKTEVCLTLTPATGSSLRLVGSSSSDTDKLWLKTKHLLIAILPAVQGDDSGKTLIGALKSRTTTDQELKYCDILDKRDIAGDQAVKTDKLDLTNVFCDEEGRLPLEDAKRLVLKNLRILEVAGYTSSKDGCQSIIKDLARDILNQRDHRIQRRKDLIKIEEVRTGLMNKQSYMNAQLEQYRMYVIQCLGNLNKAGRNRRVHFATEDGHKSKKMKSKATLKYSATKLHDKGVLQTIEGLPNNQLKNVQFVFLPLEQDGMFEVSARFMGVDMEKVVIDIQELLKLQYEGQAVLNMFGKAKVNVNLLLHLLNAKFYGK